MSSQLTVGILVNCQNVTAKAKQDVDQAASDLAGPNHARRLPTHVKTGQTFEDKVTRAVAQVGLVQTTIQHQHQRHGMFRDGVG